MDRRLRCLPVVQENPSRRTVLLGSLAAAVSACGGQSLTRDAGADARADGSSGSDGSAPDAAAMDDAAMADDAAVLDDVNMGMTCDPNFEPVGNVADYTAGAAPRFFATPQLFVARDANGFWAVTSICTHRGCDVRNSGAIFRCPCHGATFSHDGTNPTSPATRALRNFAVCIASDGSLFVDLGTTVAAGTRTPAP